MAHRLSLYLVRHAVAAERGEEWPDDAKRPLTADGVAKFRRAVQGLAEMGVEVNRILSSPLVRARQTADLLARAFDKNPLVGETSALAPGGSYDAVVRAVSGCREPAIALVGHEPAIGRLAARLIDASAPLEFRKGGICRIDFDVWPPPPPGRLRWFITPKILERLAR